jgi:hypothetical protein
MKRVPSVQSTLFYPAVLGQVMSLAAEANSVHLPLIANYALSPAWCGRSLLAQVARYARCQGYKPRRTERPSLQLPSRIPALAIAVSVAP